MIVKHEIRDAKTGFHHRLNSPGYKSGDWVTYRLPAVLITVHGTFVAVTDYWDRVQPFPDPKKIYLVKEKTDR